MSKKEKLDKDSVLNYLKSNKIDNRDNTVTYLDLANHYGISPQDSKEVNKLKKCCREAREESLISIFTKDNVSHLHLK